MKSLLSLLVLGSLTFLATGCATPAYSSKERGQMISRAWGYEWAQLQDDVDHAMLLRPPSRMSVWDLR